MRGKEGDQTAARRPPGITPAYAGKSSPKRSKHHETRDHPRVCGEKLPRLLSLALASGSPPRMRGKESKSTKYGTTDRITPAYAGKSCAFFVQRVQCGDHPRVCGEKVLSRKIFADRPGSPPRMRGKANSGNARKPNTRITPAYAGKRLKRSHRIGHFSCILCLFHSVLHRASASGGSRAGPCAPPCLPAQNAVPV